MVYSFLKKKIKNHGSTKEHRKKNINIPLLVILYEDCMYKINRYINKKKYYLTK